MEKSKSCLTNEEKNMILELISQVSFKVGQSEIAKKYEAIADKLKIAEEE